MASYRSSGGDHLAEAALGGIVALAVIALLAVAYLLVQAVRLVVRMVAQHPDNPLLRVTLGVCLGLWCLVGLVAGLSDALGLDSSVTGFLALVALVATGALVAAARIVELYHDDLFQRERTKETLVADVLHRSWWEAA